MPASTSASQITVEGVAGEAQANRWRKAAPPSQRLLQNQIDVLPSADLLDRLAQDFLLAVQVQVLTAWQVIFVSL